MNLLHRLVVSHVDVGEASTRCVVSGLAAFYTPVQLTGRWIVLVVNLGPAEIKGSSPYNCINSADFRFDLRSSTSLS